MTEITLTLKNKVGLHARPAAEMIKTAAKFKSKIALTGNEKQANAKSIITVLSLGLKRGDSLTISADGADEREAIQALSELIRSNFHED